LECRFLFARGFNNVYNVIGGMSAGVLSGYPVA
jgi:rhodanese-related sulfurtransferase